jgi:hypothetical protein
MRYLDPMGLRPTTQQRLDKATRNLTQSILSWAIGDPARFDPVEFALRLIFYREAAQQQIRDLQHRLNHMAQAQASGLPPIGGPSSLRSQDLAKQKITESSDVLEGVVRQISDILSGRRSW